MSINRNASMRPETNPAGNLLQEISEAELNQLSAGAGEPLGAIFALRPLNALSAL